jgi:mannose-6-phosphate isomerase
VHRIEGVRQRYPWGDTAAVPALLGTETDGAPWAEHWWGTHPAGHAVAEGVPLASLTGELPFMVKLLAAATPLSLQVHPGEDDAADGFARAEAAGIDLDDPRRTYRDPHAKPELLCALSRFEALCGLREPDDVLDLLARLGPDARRPPLATALDEDVRSGGAAQALVRLVVERPDPTPLVDAISGTATDEASLRWVTELARLYPGDPCVVAPLLVRHVVLDPGEAIHLTAGNVHAYLAGTGIEVMASSDNVVRLGLTSKYVDTAEALRLIDRVPIGDPVVRPVHTELGGAGSVDVWPAPGAPFTLARHVLGPDDSLAHIAATNEIWWPGSGEATVLLAGERLDLTGPATAWVVR